MILGQLGKDPRARTLLIYGHLDVQPAKVEDGWDTDPFKLVEKDGENECKIRDDDTLVSFYLCVNDCGPSSSEILMPRSYIKSILCKFCFLFFLLITNACRGPRQ